MSYETFRQPRVSFCTTCMGRLHHLRETLPTNLRQIAGFPAAELVVVDYSSPDGLHDWLMATHSAEMVMGGRLRYFRVPGKSLFSLSHARNVAMKNATGDLLFNIDADVALQPGAVAGIYQAFGQRQGQLERTGMLFADPEHRFPDLWGCIGVHRRAFLEVGGYDEDFGPRWGGEDDDFARRLAQYGVEFFPFPHEWVRAIQHGDDERSRFHTVDRTTGQAMNNEIQARNAQLGLRWANANREWGVGGIQVRV